MKINSINNFISFKKQLVATGAYLRNGESQPCYFYELKGEEDSLYLKKAIQTEEWQGSELVEPLIDNMSSFPNDEFYIIEDINQNCIGATEIFDEYIEGMDTKSIHIIETCPKFSSKNEKRQEKYIGESILSFITKLSKKENKEMIYIPVADETALEFYIDKCFFEQKTATNEKEDLPTFLMCEAFDDLIEQNEIHTEHPITFV